MQPADSWVAGTAVIRFPQIQLRTVFLLFICAAIGLTCAMAPPRGDPSLVGLIPQLNWHYAVLCASAAAMVIGLVQQTMQLAAKKRSLISVADDVAFSFLLAIAWRIAIIGIIVFCTLLELLISRQIVAMPESEGLFLTIEVLPSAVWVTALIIVLSDSIGRWRGSVRPASRSRLRRVLQWSTSITIVLLILPETALIIWLVHITTAGIEIAAPLALQREGAFPDHAAESFRLFWLSLGSMLCIAAAGGVLPAIFRKRSNLGRNLAGIAYVVLVGASGIFCLWFYLLERHRISPDLASVGVASVWTDWIGGGMLILMLVTVATFRVASTDSTDDVLQLDTGINTNVALHESFPCLLLLCTAAVLFFVELIRSTFALFGGGGFLAPPDALEVAAMIIEDPFFLLYFAVAFLSLQLCWIRWRRRDEQITWRISRVAKERFVVAWGSVALLAAVAVPTASIYAFVYWLGPWYLLK